jgi:hypothetical protein
LSTTTNPLLLNLDLYCQKNDHPSYSTATVTSYCTSLIIWLSDLTHNITNTSVESLCLIIIPCTHTHVGK